MRTKTAPETVPSDYAIVQVTLTLAVETWLCDDGRNLVHEAACDSVLNRLNADDDCHIVVLASEFTPVALTKRDQS